MLVPNSQACANQFSSTSPIPSATLAARQVKAAGVDAAVARAQQASEALAISNPWEFWRGGMNLMKDVQRSNLRFSGSPNPGPLQLPGLPAARPVSGSPLMNWLRNLGAKGLPGSSPAGSGAARGGGNAAPNWNSRFVGGPGGRYATWPGNAGQHGGGSADDSGSDARPGNCGSIDQCRPVAYDCSMEAADVVSSDGMGGPNVLSTPPANPSLTTDQAANIIVQPPAVERTAAGMGEWTDSIAKPGAVPAECTSGTSGANSGLPWWLWLVIAGVVVAAANSDERGSGGQKRAT